MYLIVHPFSETSDGSWYASIPEIEMKSRHGQLILTGGFYFAGGSLFMRNLLMQKMSFTA